MSDERRINPLAQYHETSKAGGLRHAARAMQLEPQNEYEQVRGLFELLTVRNCLIQRSHVFLAM